MVLLWWWCCGCVIIAGHTYGFDDKVAWLAVACSKSAVWDLMRIAWRTVGAIVSRVWADDEKTVDRFAKLRRVGVDEIYKESPQYLTIVVDHDTGRLVWAAAGRDTETLRRFFDELGDERCKLITRVSADAADWIADVVAERCPGAVGAPTRSTWSGGPPRRSMPSGGGPGTTRGRGRSERGSGRGRPGRDAPRARARERAQAQRGPVRAVEEPGEPHRQPEREAGLDRQDRHPAVTGLPVKEGLRHVF